MKRNEIVFLWDNFDRYHSDRCEAAADAFGPEWRVFGLELSSGKSSHAWRMDDERSFVKRTLFLGRAESGFPSVRRFNTILRACLPHLGGYFFICHYGQPEIFAVACCLRLMGQSVFTMSDAKFDDENRHILGELAKSFLYLPYKGALASGARATEYLRFLGLPKSRIVAGYDTVPTGTVRELAESAPAPDGTLFEERHFTIVARLVPKQNIGMAFEAYARYRHLAAELAHLPRGLVVCGSGMLETNLRARAKALGIEQFVSFRSGQQPCDVSHTLATTLALILPSIDDEFGLAALEAQALGVPVIVSERCGVRDDFVRNGVSGFAIEPDNPGGLALFMRIIAGDEALWRQMCTESLRSAEQGDTRNFAEGVASLINLEKRRTRRARRHAVAPMSVDGPSVPAPAAHHGGQLTISSEMTTDLVPFAQPAAPAE